MFSHTRARGGRAAADEPMIHLHLRA
eukprot:COSAG04_NODE_17585_length_465_cov_0.781421_1_plen_25_part_10